MNGGETINEASHRLSHLHDAGSGGVVTGPFKFLRRRGHPFFTDAKLIAVLFQGGVQLFCPRRPQVSASRGIFPAWAGAASNSGTEAIRAHTTSGRPGAPKTKFLPLRSGSMSASPSIQRGSRSPLTPTNNSTAPNRASGVGSVNSSQDFYPGPAMPSCNSESAGGIGSVPRRKSTWRNSIRAPHLSAVCLPQAFEPADGQVHFSVRGRR